jgi:exonuclease SbcC
MHVTRVELENIKSYAQAAFDFERGTTAIVGPNGAGKTTILEAVAWTLFDVLDYSKDDFLRRGAKKGSARVTFQDELDERLYLVYRDTGSGYYVYDTELKLKLATGKADVKKWLDQHLGIEPGADLKSLFRSAIGVPQGLFTTDFLRSPAERKSAFDRLLKVEEYQESAKRLNDTANLVKERVAEARGRISGAESQLARYDELVAEREMARERVAELDATLKQFQQETTARARAVAELDEAERRVALTRARADRLEVEHEAAARRESDLRHELAAAERAAERQRATEADYRVHLAALETLRALDTARAERDRARAEAADAGRMVAAAEADARRLEDALRRATEAQAALAAIEADVAAQEEAERERERLRELLAHARAAGEQLARLERELENLKKLYADTSRRARAAEALAGAQERAAKLESERLDIENRLSKIEQALTARKHLSSQRREGAREAERLRRSVASLEREAREFEQGAAGARGLAELEAREHALTQQAATMRAAVEREEKVSARAKGGICPILHEPCQNLAAEGRTFEDHFADTLQAGRAQLGAVEKEAAEVVMLLRSAREAERNVARLETSRARLERERELLHEREAALARVDEELAALAEASEERRDELQIEITGVSGSLIAAREDALRSAELEPLRARLKEIEEEGKARKEEREQVAASAGADKALEADIRAIETRLRQLDDPRGRAAALRVEAARESSLRAETQGARDALAALRKRQAAAEKLLERFQELDARWSAATMERDRTAAAQREHIESAALAAQLPEREREARAAADAVERAARELETARVEAATAAAAYERERHTAERGALAVAERGAADASARLEAARENDTRLASEIARLDEVRERLREEFRAKERLEEVFEATDFIRDTLKKAGPLVTESYLYNISIEANQLFRDITGEGGRALRWTKDYEIMLEEAGHERPFVNLSGGEQMAAALSIRLALLKQLSDIRVAFFDEPTINMDADRRARLAQHIGEIRNFDQLFVISHDDTFEETVDHVLSVERAAKEVA